MCEKETCPKMTDEMLITIHAMLSNTPLGKELRKKNNTEHMNTWTNLGGIDDLGDFIWGHKEYLLCENCPKYLKS